MNTKTKKFLIKNCNLLNNLQVIKEQNLNVNIN